MLWCCVRVHVYVGIHVRVCVCLCVLAGVCRVYPICFVSPLFSFFHLFAALFSFWSP